MCMSLFSALNNADNTNRPEPPRGFSKIKKYEAEKAISGNLCRCTGFRPIADVCKSFAADVDLEDLGFNIFWEKPEDANVERLPPYNQHKVCTFPEFLKCEINSSMNTLKSFKDNGALECQWYRPASFEELYELLNSSEFIESHVKMVVGNTMSGVYKEINLYDKYISLTGIPELSIIERNSKGFTLGAAVTISKAIEVLKERNGNVLKTDGELVFDRIAEHMDKVATPFVRNMASLGGNLIMAQRYQFPSDIATVLLAAGSTVCLQMASERLILSLEEFLEGPPYDDRTILVSIHIPYWSSASISSSGTSKYNIIFKTYRAAPRPLGNAVSYLNSAFLARVASDRSSGDIVLLKLHLAFGAYGTEHAIRARNVENFLVGKMLTVSVLIEAIKLLKEIIIPKEGTSHPRYRISLAVAFLFKFFQPLSKDLAQVEKNNLHIPDVILSSKQLVEFSTEYFPVGKPIKKVAAEIQASGEALYVDDIPSSKDCLYGAFIYSTRPFARIKGITFNPTLVSSKIVAYISINDIPEGGKNVGSSFRFADEPLFADSLTEYSGQCLGIVVAETQRYANMAAKQAIVQYSTKGLEPPILSVEDAVRRSSFFDIPPSLYPTEVGDLARGMDEADHKILLAEVKLESEHYFYMETQTAFAIPDEDNCIVVYSSNQYPEGTQGVIAKCLGIPQHNVRVITRRAGGGFGGKATRSNPANLQYVNLSASTFWVADDTSSYLNYGAAISEVEIDVLTGAITILRADLTYDCGQSLSPAVDLGQVEGSFVQGIGFFVYEKLEENSDGLVISDGTWSYKIPSIDTIPKHFNIRVMNSGHHKDRVLSSKASGEPPLLLAASVHSAIRKAIRAARADFSSTDPDDSSVSSFQFDPPATMPLVKELCGLDTVEKYLEAHGEV
ncbi:indole-3-acetaldehyde oxidase-like isoform X5 [Zingiber officinale]|uniref:indole-3-acetaldehyde oxidase-like isoform X5 n=1 Tax=Zingiber officinale TaxID=94328 RepID=UPI001C4C6E2A|nr:indole-3-acetaldehyde oxidase-like isoform X5 [Zingiber officinale]